MKILSELFIQISLMILFGFFLRKKNIITDELQKGLSNLLLTAILPVSVLGSVGIECTYEVVYGLIICAIISTIYYVIAFFLSLFVAKKSKLNESKKRIFILLNMFANVGFLGLPLSEALCGKEGFLIAVVYNLVYQVFLVFVGIPIIRNQLKISWELFKDPLLITSVVAILIFISPFRFPYVIQDVLDMVGGMMVPVSMIIIGADLANQKLYDIFKDKKSYLICFFRLVLFPSIIWIIMKILGISGNIILPVALLTALPCGSLNVILAKQYECEVDFASRTVILSMIFMIITLPIIILMVQSL